MRHARSGHGRRRFLRGSLGLGGLALLAGCGQPALPWRAAKVPLVGVLSYQTPASGAAQLEALRGGMRDLGYAEGRDVVLEPRFTAGRPERYPELAAELARLGAAVLVVHDPVAIPAARQAAEAVPIVMAGASEVPVERGLVASLARPGGMVTGLTQGTPTLASKRLELLKEAVPGLARAAFINDPAISPIAANPKAGVFRAAAAALGLGLEFADLPPPEAFAELFEGLARQQVGGAFVDGSPTTYEHRLRLSELATRQRLAVIWQGSLYKDAALLVYGANTLDLWRRAAAHVDKLLRGASPAELPVEQPTTFDLIVNLRIARATGLTIPDALLREATEIVK